MALNRSLRKFLSDIDVFVSTSAPRPLAGLTERFWKKGSVSYSSFGEDLIIASLFKRHEFITGKKLQYSYVDVRGWRPIRGSNTYGLHQKGIRGTVVEPNPYLFKLWKSIRPNDKFLPYACANLESIELIQFSKLAPSNTGNIDFAAEISRTQNIKPVSKTFMKAITLNQVITEHLSSFPGKFILDIDIEGDDASILENFEMVGNSRPIIILVEDTFRPNLESSPITKLLKSNNYRLVCRSVITSIFIDLDSELYSSIYQI